MATKRYYHKKKATPKPQSVESSAYSPEQLRMTLSDLGLSESLVELLEKNRITSAQDLIVRTQKDMFRVQGFNKKCLVEVQKALAAAGMALKVEQQELEQAKKQPERQENAPKSERKEQKKPEQKPQQQERTNAQERTKSRFGLADREPQKEKAPLPIEQWHKILKGGKWGFSNGMKTVIPPTYDEVFGFKEDVAAVELDGKCGYINSEGEIVIPLEYDIAMSFSEGLAMVSKGEKCGYINKEGELVFNFEYDAATPFEGGEAKVKKDGKWATLQKDGSLQFI